MPYPKVLALLDAQLERLRAAREILTSGANDNRKTDPLADLSKLLDDSSDEKKTDAALMNAAILPTRVAPRQRRERRGTVRRRKQDDAGALGSAVPNAPVYVSADKVRSTHVDRAAGQAVVKQEEQLSPELLARRWLQTSAN